VLGIEITEESRVFAESMGLRVFKYPNSEISFDTVLFLHSFEHLAPAVLVETLNWIASSNCRRIVISVPNLNSLGYKLFGQYNAFHDPVNHPAIYSQQGLDKAFASIKFARKSSFRIWSYTIFGVAQSFLNYMFKSRNEFYLRLKREDEISNRFMFLIHFVSVFLLMPALLPFFVIHLFAKKCDFVMNFEYVRIS
jgi:hypothetical protein